MFPALVVALGLACTSPRDMPDARFLAAQAVAHGVDTRVVLAMAWTETRCNISTAVRGQAGEVGRFQISPETARRWCRGLNIHLYHENVRCFFRLFVRYQAELDIPGLLPLNAIRRYNGRGPKAHAYVERVLKIVRVL